MPAPSPAARLANVLSLPARHLAVVDAGHQRARILFATAVRGHPRLTRTEVIDAHEEGFTTEKEVHEEARRRLREAQPEAVLLVLPQARVLRHVLDLPRGDAQQTRAQVEREASNIGGLSESAWFFDAVRSPGPPDAPQPVIAAFCRQDDLQQLFSDLVDDPLQVFDVRSCGDALAAAFAGSVASTAAPTAILVDLGATQTTIALIARGRVASLATFPNGSATFTEALAVDRASTREAAEVLKRTEPPPPPPDGPSHFRTALLAWLAEFERTLHDSAAEHPTLADAFASAPAFLAGGGALQPRLPDDLSRLGNRPFQPWPETLGGGPALTADFAACWGTLRLALGESGPAPALLPPEHRAFWKRQRLWRAVLSANFTLAAMLLVALAAATLHQTRQLASHAVWRDRAQSALRQAQDIRSLSELLNERMDRFRPVLARQRQTADTLRLLTTLQRHRTNTDHWYVLLADGASYAAGSNTFAARPTPARAATEARAAPLSPATNTAPLHRSFVAEVCFVAQGESMRQALSDLVTDLKREPLFRNVDVLPAERRRDWVATNLYFPDRHFALELNLSDVELLPSLPLPPRGLTNREPRHPFRAALRNGETATYTNATRPQRPR